MKNNILSDNFLPNLLNFFNLNFAIQIILFLLCYLLSVVFCKFFKKNISPKILAKLLKINAFSNNIAARFVNLIVFPISLFFLICLVAAIYSNFSSDLSTLIIIIKLCAIFIVARILTVFVNNNIALVIFKYVALPTFILDVLGVLQNTILFLDNIALKIGGQKISVYLIIKGLMVLLTLFWLVNIILKKSKAAIDNNKNFKPSTKGIINKFIDIIVYSAAVIILLKTFGFDMTTFAVLGGAIGVGIGFGLQKIASNFISGIILLFEKSVEVGDWIEIEGANIFGVIKHFGGRYTLIECFDGKEIMVPNEDFITGKVTNWTFSNNRARIEINISVAHGSDLQLVKEVMIQAAKNHNRCLSYPEIECYVINFGEYDIKFTLFFWVSDITCGRMSAKSDVMMEIWQKFTENNIKIPVPIREIKNY